MLQDLGSFSIYLKNFRWVVQERLLVSEVVSFNDLSFTLVEVTMIDSFKSQR